VVSYVDSRAGTAEAAITVRVPEETLERIDALVQRRQTRIPRHSWLLEAIYEKLDREERVQGDLEILLEKNRDTGIPNVYRLRFFRFDRAKGSPLTPMPVVGDDTLEKYLLEWGLTSENAKGWIQKLSTDRMVSVRDIVMPAQRVGRYGFKTPGWGIQTELGDGRTALLGPDLTSLPDGTRAYKITAWGPNGEEAAMVTKDGRVLILLEEHIWPPGEPPGTIRIKLAEASEKEAEEFLDIYRRYVPD
jgi:predicted transcriptional regulator